MGSLHKMVSTAKGKGADPNIQYKFDGDFRKGTTPTLLDAKQAQRVKAFIENLVFRSMFQIETGAPPSNSLIVDFSNDQETWFRLALQTALHFDKGPTLGGHLRLESWNIRATMAGSKFEQYVKEGFQIHPQSRPGDTVDAFASRMRLCAWESSAPYNVGFMCPPVSDLAASGSLDADNGLVWTLPYEDGTDGQVLQTDGSRVLSFVDSGGGSYSWTARDEGLSNEEITNGMSFEFHAGTFLACGLTVGPTPYIEYDLGASGTPDDTKFLRGDNVWAVPSGGGGMTSWTVEDTDANSEDITNGLILKFLGDTFLASEQTGDSSDPEITYSLTASGTADDTTFLRGDNTWAVPSGGGSGMTSFTVASVRYTNPFESPITSSWVMTNGKEIEFWSYDKSISCSAATDEKMNIQIPYGEFTYDGDLWGHNAFVITDTDGSGYPRYDGDQHLMCIENRVEYNDPGEVIIFSANHNEHYEGWEDGWRFLRFHSGYNSSSQMNLRLGRQVATNIEGGYNGDPLNTGDGSATDTTLVYDGGTITHWYGDIPIGGEEGDGGTAGTFKIEAGPGIHIVYDIFGTTTYNIGLLHHIDEEDTGTYGSATKSPVIAVNKQGVITDISEVTITGGGGGGSGTVTSIATSNGLEGGTITTSGTLEIDDTVAQTVSISADGGTASGDSDVSVGNVSDNTVELVAGDGVTLTGDDSAGTIKIESSGGGGGSLTVKEVDGSPSVSSVDTIVVSNGTLTDDGGGQVTVTTGGGGGCGTLPESDHPYPADSDESWEYECCCASSIDVTFNADTATEEGYDYIYIYDGDDVQISGSPFEGTELASATKTVSGSKVKIRLTSDGSVQEYGFKVTSIVASGGGSGTVTSITAGTGLDGGTITTSGTVDLGDTAVAAGSYTNTDLTVDAQGRITAASNGSGGGGGGVTSVATSNGTFVDVTGGTITSTGTITGDLSATGTPGASVYLRGDNTWAVIGSDESPWQEDGDDIYFDGGDVAIGVTTPVSKLTIEGTATLKEQAEADADTAGYGQIWVKDDAPNTLWFTDDAGTDTQLGTGGGGSSMSTATITSGTSSTIPNDGTDYLIRMDDYDPGDNYLLTIPRPGDVAAGRRFQFWLANESSYYFAAQTSDSSDLFQTSYDLYNDGGAFQYLITYLYTPVIFTIYSDGVDTWYSGSAAFGGEWWGAETPIG